LRQRPTKTAYAVERPNGQKTGLAMSAVRYGSPYAFTADEGTVPPSQRKTHDFERRSTRIVALRFSWDCFGIAGFKWNNGQL